MNAHDINNKGLAAWVAKEERAIAFTFKVSLYTSELMGQEYALVCSRWEPLQLAIEGATVVAAQPKGHTVTSLMETSPVPAQPGFLKRIANALS